MVKHIILWTIKEEYNTDAVKQDMKRSLEGLVSRVPGLLKMQIEISPLPSSSADVMLYSEFESAEALRAYSVHPAHVEVANGKVRPFTKTRTAFDFEVK